MVRSRASLHLEIIALRHQLAVVNRSRRPRLRFTSADRMLWAWLLIPPHLRQHLHSRQHSVAAVGVNRLDLFVVWDKIVFTMGELKGNIWMAEFCE